MFGLIAEAKLLFAVISLKSWTRYDDDTFVIIIKETAFYQL